MVAVADVEFLMLQDILKGVTFARVALNRELAKLGLSAKSFAV